MTNHIISFDIAPGEHEHVPSDRMITWAVPEERLMESLEALAILNKSVKSIDIADSN